jgi:ribonuclease HII
MQSKYKVEDEIGIDEAGRGPLLGRVYAGAVIWNNDNNNNNIMDSKKLSPKKRAIALEWIKKNVKAWGVGYAEPNEIDNLNILEATKLAMNRAITNLKENFNLYKNNNNLIIDGINWENKFSSYNVNSIVKGDNLYYSIASASIIAKEYHDMYIKDLCEYDNELNNKYDLLKCMGYGTKKHLEGIKTYGYSKYHRKSFVIKNLTK